MSLFTCFWKTLLFGMSKTTHSATPLPKKSGDVDKITKQMGFLDINDEAKIHTVRSKITNISKNSRRTKFEIEGRNRSFWFVGDTTLSIGDYVEIRYQLVTVKEYRHAWIVDITKLESV